MGLEEVVNLTILTVASAPSRASFGTPLIMAYHNVVPAMLAAFKSLSELTDAGFAVTDPAYRAATAVFSQNPRPAQIVIGKRTHVYTQTLEFTPVNLTAGFHYTFEGVDSAGVVTTIDYQVQPADTVNLVCVGLAALIDPMANGTGVATPAAPNATKVVWTSTAGKLANFRKLPRPQDMKVKDTTADPGIAADLSAIETLDDTSWYAIGFDHSGKATIEAAAAWVEARRKIALCNTSDSETLDPLVSNDVSSDLKAAAYSRTEVLGSYSEILSYSALAWLGVMLPKDPGSATWAFKTLKGITADKLTGGQKTAAKNKRLNTYTTLGGINVTQWGQDPDGGYTDIVVGTDWLFARIQEAVYAAFTAVDKIPYTDSGVDTIRNVINSVLRLAVKKGFLAEDPAFTITAPKVADVDPAARANRNLPDVNFSATLAGAIHTVDILGRLSV